MVSGQSVSGASVSATLPVTPAVFLLSWQPSYPSRLDAVPRIEAVAYAPVAPPVAPVLAWRGVWPDRIDPLPTTYAGAAPGAIAPPVAPLESWHGYQPERLDPLPTSYTGAVAPTAPPIAPLLSWRGTFPDRVDPKLNPDAPSFTLWPKPIPSAALNPALIAGLLVTYPSRLDALAMPPAGWTGPVAPVPVPLRSGWSTIYPDRLDALTTQAAGWSGPVATPRAPLESLQGVYPNRLDPLQPEHLPTVLGRPFTPSSTSWSPTYPTRLDPTPPTQPSSAVGLPMLPLPPPRPRVNLVTVVGESLTAPMLRLEAFTQPTVRDEGCSLPSVTRETFRIE